MNDQLRYFTISYVITVIREADDLTSTNCHSWQQMA